MTRPRGRPSATRGVFAIEDQVLLLPSMVAFDTSFVVEALVETQPLHQTCAGFLERLVEAETTIVTSELLVVELAEAAFAIALKERWGRDWRRHAPTVGRGGAGDAYSTTSHRVTTCCSPPRPTSPCP